MKNFFDQIEIKSDELERKNLEIENSDFENKEKKISEAGEIEKQLDEMEKKLDISKEEVLKIYETLSVKKAEEILRQEGLPESLSVVGRGVFQNILKKIKGNKVLIAACLLFLTFNSRAGADEISEKETATHIFKQEKKQGIKLFLSSLRAGRKFYKQESLEFLIPPKPPGYEKQEWELQIFDEHDNIIGRFVVDNEKGYIATFARDKKIKTRKVELLVKIGVEIEKYPVNISDEEKIISGNMGQNKKNKDFLEKISTVAESKEGYNDKFEAIREALESDAVSEAEKQELKNYFLNLTSEFVYYLLDNCEPEDALNEFENNRLITTFVLCTADDNIAECLFDLKNIILKKIYQKDTAGLSGVDKIKKIFKNCSKYRPFCLVDDEELACVLKSKIEKVKNEPISSDSKKTMEELGGIFDNYVFYEGSPFHQIQKEYQELKKEAAYYDI